MTALAHPLVLTVPEAAEALGISRAKAYSLARSGHLPTIHFGRSVRVPLEGLKALLLAWTQRSLTSGHAAAGEGDHQPAQPR